ncbi:MAG: hypothetical protein P4L90_04450 [Rhodopila sp.]|nr:hypothetical protein [Rhodopila sp.]
MTDDVLPLAALAVQRGSLYPEVGHSPYYVVTPRYIQSSAGVRCLHLLIHWLNRIGCHAYAYFPSEWESEYRMKVNPDLITPPLTQDIIDFHFANMRSPIVICPEIFPGTLPNAPLTVRWFGNYPGAIASLETSERCDMKYAFSRRLAVALGEPENVLCIPVIDTRTFRKDDTRERHGSCFYASKFKMFFGGVPFDLPPGSIEITRDLPDSQTPQEIAELFRRSEYFYCFEESALVVEAGLCGCPTILMKSEYFTNPLGVDDFGWDGFAWGNDRSEVDRAKQTVHKVERNYEDLIKRFFPQLEAFVTKTQAAAAGCSYPTAIRLPSVDLVAKLSSSLDAEREQTARLQSQLMEM